MSPVTVDYNIIRLFLAIHLYKQDFSVVVGAQFQLFRIGLQFTIIWLCINLLIIVPINWLCFVCKTLKLVGNAVTINQSLNQVYFVQSTVQSLLRYITYLNIYIIQDVVLLS